MSKAKKALEAKEKGNELFKAGRVDQSVKFYAEAENIDPENPVYPSNLSAAQYEIGDYLACVDAILRSWSRKQEKELAAKLSTRLAKALCHAAQSSALSASYLEANTASIDSIEKAGKEVLGDHAENDLAWNTWDRIKVDIANHEKLSREAKVRLLRFPIFRGTPESHLTYHTFGMDEYIDLIRDLGPDGYDPIKIQSLPSDRLAELSFLLGGVGDGRHAFGTLVGLGRAASKLTQPKRGLLKGHVTLLDIHPAIIARNLLMFMMIHTLAQDTLDATTRLELHATLVYVFIGWVMPPYCEKRTLGVINDLLDRLSESPPRLPAWLHVNTSSIKPVMKSLDFWANARDKKTEKVLEHLTHMDPDEMFRAMGRIPQMNLEGLGLAMPRMDDKNEPYGLSGEVKFLQATGGYIPPSKLWSRHQGTALTSECAKGGLSAGRFKKIGKDILATWKPNITIFVPNMEDNYLHMQLDAFAPIRLAADFNKAHGLSQKDKDLVKNAPTMGHMMALFDGIVDAVKVLGAQLRCEFIAGDINEEMSKVRMGADTRPNNFPKTWTRIWLSNIPDYTHGTLNTSIFVVPVLQSSPEAAVSSNCLWNSPVWKSDDEFCYNYTMLLAKDLPKYLGIRVIRGEAVMNLLTLGANPLPRPLSSLASREELRSWLTRLFLCFIWPGFCKARPDNIRIPNNVAAFVRLLAQLHAIGYPSHWLAEFLHNILTNNMMATRNIWNEVLPRPVSDLYERTALHKTRLDPWEAEMEAIVASSWQGLPFAVQMPSGFARCAKDIGLFKAKVSQIEELQMFNPVQIDPVISLVFYKRSWTAGDAHRAVIWLPKLVDGHEDPSPGSFYVYSAPMSVNFLKPAEVQWKMSKARAKKMRDEGWSMVAWRSDHMLNATMPVPSRDWVEML